MTGPFRILVIDDDAVSRHALGEVLEAAGFAVAAEEDGVDLVVSVEAVERPGIPCLRVVKPVRVGALLAEIRETLAHRDSPEALVRIGKWRFDAPARLLEDEAGERVRLTDKEAAILDHLRRVGGVVARETLLAEVWNYSASVTTHTLETHIYRLRRKIEANPTRATLLVSEPGGYRLAD